LLFKGIAPGSRNATARRACKRPAARQNARQRSAMFSGTAVDGVYNAIHVAAGKNGE
jgi:hypothetical protein